MTWGLADQVVSSVTNIVLTVIVARHLDSGAFGAFAIVYATYLLIVGAVRSVTGEPYAASSSGVEDERSEVYSSIGGVALFAGLLSGVVLVGFGTLLSGTLARAAIVVGLVLPGLVCQDVARQLLLSSARQRSATINDFVWAFLQLVGFLLLGITNNMSAPFAVLVWGVSAAVAGVLGFVQLGAVPRIQSALVWWRQSRSLGLPFFGDFLVTAGADQLIVYLLAALVGLPAVGAVRAVHVLYGPLNIVLTSGRLVGVAEIRRSSQGRFKDVERSAAIVACLFASVAVVWGVLLSVLPATVGELLLGATWDDASQIMEPLLGFKVAMAVTSGALIGLRVLQRALAGLVVKSALAVARIGLSAILALRFGLIGALWASTAVASAGAALTWWTLHASGTQKGNG